MTVRIILTNGKYRFAELSTITGKPYVRLPVFYALKRIANHGFSACVFTPLKNPVISYGQTEKQGDILLKNKKVIVYRKKHIDK